MVVLLHGLLFRQRMHEPLAMTLAERGNRVVTLDLLGHGLSDRPRDMWKYSMSFFAAEAVALLDHLGVEEAVVLGTSLGANTALEMAPNVRLLPADSIVELRMAPERLTGEIAAFIDDCWKPRAAAARRRRAAGA